MDPLEPSGNSKDDTDPFPLSTWDSSTNPSAAMSTSALSSATSARVEMVSVRVSRPLPVRPETSTAGTSPPISSRMTPAAARPFLILSTLALCLSTLLMATTSCTFGASSTSLMTSLL